MSPLEAVRKFFDCYTARPGREAQAGPEVGWQAEAPDEIEMELQ